MADTPKIRFKGFTDEWEERKLIEEVSSIDTGKSKFVVSELGNYEILGSTSVIGYDDSYDYDGDFILTARVGANAGELYRHSGKVKISDNTVFIQGKQLEFIFYTLQNFNIKKLSFGTGQPLVKASELKEQKIAMPVFENERKQIGTYFCHLDHLISLHQRKYDEAKELKKYMLQKMFPRNGKKNPEIRFAGFTDDWEQRKALELAKYSKGNGYSKGDLTEVGTPIILYGRLYTKYQFTIDEVDTFAIPQSGSVYSQGNEVIVPASGENAEDIARASAVEKSGVLLGGDLNILRPFDFVNPLFLALAISNGEPQKELAKKAQGKSVVHIHNSDIQEVTISYPLRAEQDQIVAIFCYLDHLITLHQRKHDELKEVKKFMLQNMFPQKG